MDRPELLRDVAQLRATSRSWRAAGRPVVLVPTMGDLHEGHLSLVRAGAAVGPVMVSIFVNPTQFGPGEDYERYPRDLEADLDRLAELGVEAVFAPAPGTMYAPGASTWVEVEGITDVLCGAHRPGHFRGVTTIVAQLLIAAEPDVACFGQKDAQQCLVIDRMVRDLHLPVRLLLAPTVRDDDGLALSSRNRYLDPAAREQARRLPAALRAGRALLEGGERESAAVEAAMRAVLAPLRLDYAELRTVPDLGHPATAGGRVLLAAAAHVGPARLIDNLVLQLDGDGARPAPLLDDATPEAVAAALGGARREGGA